MNIEHEPITESEKVEKSYGTGQDGQVRYVCTTELNEPDVPVDIFYRTKPSNDDDRGYFGLYWNKGDKTLSIMNADMVEGMQFAMIEHDNVWHYSSTLSDEKEAGGKIIGGGRQHIAGWGFEIFVLEQGIFHRTDK
jgi:hypothetical protein